MFIRQRTFKKNGRTYTYLYAEERWREGGKVKSRSWIIRGAGSIQAAARKEAVERFRDVFRQNNYIYGSSHPFERRQREVEAQKQYFNFLDGAKNGDYSSLNTDQERHEKQQADFWLAKDREPTSPFEQRHRAYQLSRGDPVRKAEDHYMALREEVHKQDKAYDAKIAEQFERNDKANEEWLAEQKDTPATDAPSEGEGS